VVATLLAAQPQLSLVPAERVLASLDEAGSLAPDRPPLTAGPYLRILPGEAGTDGFFAAIFEKAR
jgi:16S rRNA C967 or C1407 C5-methylase (RsmB/RsmF family)